jgi:uncharacterized protein
MADYEYHEPVEELGAVERDRHRAVKSMIEELEAIDWYQQRAATSANQELKEVLRHNRDEEMEHAAMLLEWLRRNVDGWHEKLRRYLFTAQPITSIEAAADGEDGLRPAAPSGDLGIGGLKEG